MRQALQRLAEAQQDLRQELERSRELFRRAAVEGQLASLAADAEELRGRQQEWNRESAPRADSVAAAAERALAERADTLSRGIAEAARDLAQETRREAAAAPLPLAAARAAAARARHAMGRAAQSAAQADRAGAGDAGREAAAALDSLPEQLRGVLFHQDLCLEVQPGVPPQVFMVLSSVTIGASVRTSSVGIDAEPKADGMMAGVVPGAGKGESKKKLLPVTPWGRYLKVLLSSSEFLFVN